jgi:hypothetical protein
VLKCKRPKEEMPNQANQEESGTDKALRFGEACIVLSITFLVLLVVGYGLFWLVWCDQPTRSVRMVGLTKALNDNWKVTLILLVPLFYRTIRLFLERVEKAFGMEAPHRQPPVGEKGNEIRPSQLEKLPSEAVADSEAAK